MNNDFINNYFNNQRSYIIKYYKKYNLTINLIDFKNIYISKIFCRTI